MKKILIFSQAMELGGAETALLGLLDTIDTTKYSVDLFLMRHNGELLKHIPKEINLLPEDKKYSSLAVPFSVLFKKGQFRIAFLRLLAKVLSAIKAKKLKISDSSAIPLEYSHKFTCTIMPKISNTEYDLAISFLTPHYFVANKVKAKKKIAWIHTDYSYIKIDVKSELNMWNKYDNIISISNDVTASFAKTFPSLKEKVLIIENIISKNYVDSLVNAFSPDDEMPKNKSIKLLSIGRFCHQKNFDNVPQICKTILDNSLNVKWYIIGFGGDEALIRQKIAEHGMQNNVIILGKKANPYPYINACDIYVQPSRYEGKSVAVREAQMLNKPVIITDFPTSKSQLKDGFDGVIVPIENTACANALSEIIKDTALQQKLIANTKSCDYTNSQEIQKLYSFLNS